MLLTVSSNWGADWLWSLPLIVLTVVIHAFGLGFIDHRLTLFVHNRRRGRLPPALSMLVIGGAAFWATMLHAFESSLWACAYLLLGALTGRQNAMLYSLNAMTSYGHADIYLEQRWQLMGGLECLNGWILFGLTTAFLFNAIKRVLPHID